MSIKPLVKFFEYIADVVHRLLFTKDDDMDLTQVYFGLAVLFFFFAFAQAGNGNWKVSVAAWSVFGSIFGVLAIAGTANAVSARLAASKLPGEIGAAVSKAPYEPNMYKDDERGEFTQREAV